MIDTKGLDEFRSEWDRLNKKDAEPAKQEQPKDTGVVNIDDFDYGDPVKDTAKATEIEESKAESAPKTEVKTTEEVAKPVDKPEMTFKERFAQARKAGDKVFDWVGKDGKTTKIAVKLKSEIGKPVAKPAPVAKPTVTPEKAFADEFNKNESQAETNRLANGAKAAEIRKNNQSWLPPSWGGVVDTDKQVASVPSPTKTSSPMRSIVKVEPNGKGVAAPEGGYKLMGKA